MAVTNNTPNNINFASPLKFGFQVKKLPNINFFCQAVTMPGMSVQAFQSPTPFVKLPVPGDHVDFQELILTFRVDEDMKNYLEIFNWLMALGFPENFDQYKTLADKDKRLNPLASGEDGIYSDANLIIQNSAAVGNLRVDFVNLFPVSLSELQFDTRQTDVEYLECIASFAFERFSITTKL